MQPKFTGKERDSETGLDYFGARYNASNMGRFTSPDPEGAGASVLDPQSWNGYAYARNNPLLYVDPDGLSYHVCDEHGQNCSDPSDAEFADRQKSAQASGEVWKDGKIYVDGEFKGTYRQTDVDLPGDPEANRAAAAMIVDTFNSGMKEFGKNALYAATGGVIGYAAGEFVGGFIEGVNGVSSSTGTIQTLELSGAAEAANSQRQIGGVLKQIEQGATKGKIFNNLDGRLPPGNYREYTVPGAGGGRGAARLVVDQATGAAYYTWNHYGSFIRIR